MTSSLFLLDTVVVGSTGFLNDVRFKNNLTVVKVQFIACWITHHYGLKFLFLRFVEKASPESYAFHRSLRENCANLFTLQFLFLSSFCFASLMILQRSYEETLRKKLAKPSIKRHNICDLKWQIRHQREVRESRNREKLISNAVNFHLSINFIALRWLTKSSAMS